MTNQKSNFLGDFTARQVDNLLGTISRYTRFVVFTKHTLVILIVLTVGAVIVIPILSKDQGGVRIAFSGISQQSEPLTPKMLNPQFRGFDSSDQPFTVTAEYALQKDDQTVQLVNVVADITLKDGKWISLKAQDGLLMLKEKKMSASGQVNVFYDDGYEFNTQQLNVDMETKIISSDQAVHGQGPVGTIEASGFQASHESKSIHFNGPVKLVIFTGDKS
jgi:lipopolysaccharide export system protein LptC